MPDLSIVVTGGARGIGAKVIETLARQPKFCLFYSYLNNPNPVFESLGNVFGFQADGSTEIGSKSFSDYVLSKVDKVDCLINNLGVAKFELLNNTRLETWQRTFQTNINSAFYMYKLFVVSLARARGKIINMNSIVHRMPSKGTGSYAASKAALATLSKQMASECAQLGIDVFTLSPGFILSDAMKKDEYSMIRESNLKQVPLNRFGMTDDVAQLVEFVVSEKLPTFSGSCFDITGGQHVF